MTLGDVGVRAGGGTPQDGRALRRPALTPGAPPCLLLSRTPPPFPSSAPRWSTSPLLADHERQVGTRSGRRALGAFAQAVAYLRWMLEATKVARLALDNAIGRSTAYRYLHEATDVVAAQAPHLRTALEEARRAGYRHVAIDGTVIATDRSRAIGPTAGVDLWWSGKHGHHGGNVQVITAPDGFPIYTSPVRPGREHDSAALRAHPGLLDDLAAWHEGGRAVLADLGYEGERSTMRLPIRGKRNVELTRFGGHRVAAV